MTLMFGFKAKSREDVYISTNNPNPILFLAIGIITVPWTASYFARIDFVF